MKKIMTMMGIAGALCLAPSCKKNDVEPNALKTPVTQEVQNEKTSLVVVLDSKTCSRPQEQYTSATIDIRGIKVYSEEHGWQELETVPGAWDVVSLQSAPMPIAELTEPTGVKPGMISQIALTFGDNNQLVVNDAPARCYNLGEKEIVLDFEGEIKADMLNQLVISIDICGNIIVNEKYNEDPCYTLNPVMAFESLTPVVEGMPLVKK
jgi:hypothetical protein